MINIFFSYSHEDEILRNELAKHLSLLVTQGTIKAWHDGKISAGTVWDAEIKKNLNAADIILLLVSADFLASDYIGKVELKQAMKRHEAGKVRVIPVILRPVDDWESAPFGNLQALPEGGKAVTTWSNHDEAFADIVRGIRKVIEEIGTQKAGEESQVGGNYVLLSPDTEFNLALWKELEKYKEKLGITKFIDLREKTPPERFGSYKEYLDDFIIRDKDKEAKWLFTIWPEDRRSIWLESDYQQYLEQLRNQKKYIICFESGMTWNKYQEAASEKSVFIIRTEFSRAVRTLISYATDYFLKKQKNINIVAILGPQNSPPAQERREIYNQFLEKLYHSRGLSIKDSDDWTGLMKELEHIQNIQTTYLEINNWDKQEAKDLVKSIYSSLKGNSIFYQTCFLCGNDQIAIGVNEALREQLKNEYKNERFLYIGFDGISEMEQFLQGGMIGATMKVNFQKMCKQAIKIIENPEQFMKYPPQLLMPQQISNPPVK
jgi:ABC-type sugar transport system substrate-binding protein